MATEVHHPHGVVGVIAPWNHPLTLARRSWSATAQWAAMSSPMGGRKQSGIGRRHGEQGLLRLTESQTIVEQRVGLEPLYAGGRRMAAALTTALRVARRTRLPWP